MTTNYYEDVGVLMPWLPEGLRAIYTEKYIETGDPDLAMAEMRSSELYETFYPGIRRDDGSLRMDEFTYTSTVEGYRDVLNSIGINPDLFDQNYGDLISGDVSVPEFAEERVYPLYDRVLSASPIVLDEYNRINQTDLTEEGVVALMLNPDLEERVLNKQLTMAEIGGEFAERGYELMRETAEALFQQGIQQPQAEKLAGVTANVLPAINVLASRHADPEDPFDLQEFVQAEIMDDPLQRARMRRLVRQEAAMFANAAGQGLPFARTQLGGVGGLQAV